jgi:hypothetical protein
MLLRSLLLLAVCALSLSSAAAQSPTPWSILLYNTADGALVRVDLDGGVETYDLGLPQPPLLGPRQIAISDDGARAAYCLHDGRQTTLIVRDLALGVALVEQPMPNGMTCSVAPGAFDQRGRLAVAVFSEAGQQNDWEIRLIDTGGAVVDSLTAAALAADDLIIRPQVRDFRSDALIFAAVPYGIGGAPDADAYRWQLDSDTVTPMPHWGAFIFDQLDATGEQVWAQADPLLPSGNPGAPIRPFNALRLVDPDGGERLIYHCPDWILIDALFVTDGQALAFQLLEPVGQADERAQMTRWLTLTRDGVVRDVGVFSAESRPVMANAPGGDVLLWAEAGADDFAHAAARLDYFDGTSTRMLWKVTLPPKTGENPWAILWAAPPSGSDALPPFFDYTPPCD